MAENYDAYKPKYKVGQKVLSINRRDIGTIKKINNECSKLFFDEYDNPGHKEYYIEWRNKAWTRHYCYEVDNNTDKHLIVVTPAVRVLYGKGRLSK